MNVLITLIPVAEVAMFNFDIIWRCYICKTYCLFYHAISYQPPCSVLSVSCEKENKFFILLLIQSNLIPCTIMDQAHRNYLCNRRSFKKRICSMN